MSGYVLKVRGGGGLTLREYRCPEHGVFEALVPRDAGDEQPCPATGKMDEPGFGYWLCQAPSPRCFTSAPAVHTQFVVSVVRGKDDPKPHPNAMDLRPLAEGQKMHEWRAERAQHWERDRQRRVMEYKRS